jgi:uncharacterized protein (TIGR02001 family)
MCRADPAHRRAGLRLLPDRVGFEAGLAGSLTAVPRFLVVAVLALAAAPACAQVSGQIALATDYRFRGVSLSDGPALEASLSYDHPTGLFAGLFASNVDLRQAGLGVQAYGGYARRWGDARAWDIGIVGYAYPPSPRGTRYDFVEAFAGTTFERFSLRLYASNDYYGGGDPSLYAEGGAGFALAAWLTLGVHIGVLGVWPQQGEAGSPQTRLDGRIGLTAEAAGFNIDLSLVGTNKQGDRCPAGPGRCDPGLVLTVSRGF